MAKTNPLLALRCFASVVKSDREIVNILETVQAPDNLRGPLETFDAASGENVGSRLSFAGSLVPRETTGYYPDLLRDSVIYAQV